MNSDTAGNQAGALKVALRLAKKLLQNRPSAFCKKPRKSEIPERGYRIAKAKVEDYGYGGINNYELKDFFDRESDRYPYRPSYRLTPDVIRFKGGSLLQKLLCVMAWADEGCGCIAVLKHQPPVSPDESAAILKEFKSCWMQGCVPALFFTRPQGRENFSAAERSGMAGIAEKCRMMQMPLFLLTDITDPREEPDLGEAGYEGACKFPGGRHDRRALLLRLTTRELAPLFFTGAQLDALCRFARDLGETALITYQFSKYSDLRHGRSPESAALLKPVMRYVLRLRREKDPLKQALAVSGLYFNETKLKDGALQLISSASDKRNYLRWLAARDLADEEDFAGSAKEEEEDTPSLERGRVPPKTARFDEKLVCAKGGGSDLADTLKALSKSIYENGALKDHAGTVLLWGPEGSGKSVFAHHLAEVCRRCLEIRTGASFLYSDPGVCEAMLEDALSAVNPNYDLLVIEDAGCLLEDRGAPRQGSPSPAPGLFLNCLKNFKGLLVCTAGDRRALSPAVRQCFTFELEFTYASAKQLARLWNRYLKGCAIAPLQQAEKTRLTSLAFLTPGDFVCVRNRHDRQALPKVSAASMLDELAALSAAPKADRKFKQNNRRFLCKT